MFQRRATSGNAVPTWLTTPGPVYVRCHARQSKHDPIVEEAELIEANPEYAFVRFSNGHESTVSIRDLAPCTPPSNDTSSSNNTTNAEDTHMSGQYAAPDSELLEDIHAEPEGTREVGVSEPPELRRSTRRSIPPSRYPQPEC